MPETTPTFICEVGTEYVTGLSNCRIDIQQGTLLIQKYYQESGVVVDEENGTICVTLTQGTWSTLYTMPAGYRPYSILAATTWAGYTNGIPIVCGGRITTTGAIQAMTQSTNGLVIVDLEYDAFA